MAVETVRGSTPPTDHPSSETFVAETCASLNGSSPKVDAVGKGLICCQHARDCIWAARAAREDGNGDLALAWLKSAEFFRLAAAVWHQIQAGRRGAP
jgi:hypothetical protein